MADFRFLAVNALVLAVMASPASAQVLSDVIPAQAMHCAMEEPPPQAGIAATPGGFMLMFPRSGALTDRYTGCKLLWVVDGEKMRRLATLYFKNGVLTIAAAHDVRDGAGKVTGACALPEGRSLLPRSGQQTTAAACAGIAEEGLYALRVPTWPRSCLVDSRAAVCLADPR